MNIDDRNLFREIALIKNERLLIDNHIILGKISDIDYQTGEIIYLVKSQSIFHTAGMEYHGTLFFDAAEQSCFVSGKVYFQPPNHIIIIPLGTIAVNNRKESRIQTPTLPSEISYKHGLIHQAIKGFITNLSSCGAGISTEEQLQNDIIYQLKTFFPFHNLSLQFISSFAVKQCKARKNMFLSGISFLDMDAESRKNLAKYINRKKT